MRYLIRYCRTPEQPIATMSLGSGRDALDLVRRLAAGSFTLSSILRASRSERPLRMARLESRAGSKRSPSPVTSGVTDASERYRGDGRELCARHEQRPDDTGSV